MSGPIARKQVLVAEGGAARLVLEELFSRLGHDVFGVNTADALTAEIAKRYGVKTKASQPTWATAGGVPVDLLVLSLRLVHTGAEQALVAFRDAGVVGGVILVGEAPVGRPRGIRSLGDRALLAEGVGLAELVFSATDLLFPHQAELRRYDRVFGGFPVLYLAGAQWIKGEVFNLSREGAFIETLSPLAVGTELRVKFLLPQSRETIELRGQVARTTQPSPTGSPPGMGLKFTQLTHRDEDTLKRFVTHRRAR